MDRAHGPVGRGHAGGGRRRGDHRPALREGCGIRHRDRPGRHGPCRERQGAPGARHRDDHGRLRGFPAQRGDGPYSSRTFLFLASVSPPTRGWTSRTATSSAPTLGFPAHAGMDRAPATPPRQAARFPRPRGDGPIHQSRGGPITKLLTPAIGSVVNRSTGDGSRPSSRSATGQRGEGIGRRAQVVGIRLRVQRLQRLRVHPGRALRKETESDQGAGVAASPVRRPGPRACH